MLITSKTYKDTRYRFKARLMKECQNHINGKKSLLTNNKLFYEIKTAFSYEEKKFIQLDHIDLCIIIRTLVILDIKQPEKIEIFKIWQGKAKEQIDDFTSQGISNIFTAIAKLKFPREEIKKLLPLLIKAAENIEKKANIKERFNSQGIANTLWSLAKLEVPKKEITELLPLLMKAAENIEKRADIKKKFNSQGIANTLWAFVTLEVPKKEIKALLPLLIEEAVKKIKDFNSQAIANTLWSLAVLEQDLNNFPTLKENIMERLEAFKPVAFTIENETQLFQALTHYNLSSSLLKLGISAELIKQTSALSSKLHKDVEKNLQAIIKGFPDCQITNEFFLPEIASHIDIKLQYKGKTYYIQIDGPYHFNSEGNYTTIDKFHNRLFEKVCPGETMIRLPYFFLTDETFQNNYNRKEKSQDFHYDERKITLVLEKMLENIENLTTSGVYEASKEGLTKIQNLGLKQEPKGVSYNCGKREKEEEDLSIEARKRLEHTIAPERLERDLVPDGGKWEPVKNKRHKSKQEAENKIKLPSTKLSTSSAIGGNARGGPH